MIPRGLRIALGCAAALALAGCGRRAPAPAPLETGATTEPAVAPSVAAPRDAGMPVPADPARPVPVDAGAGADAGGPSSGDMITLPAGIYLMGSPMERGSPEERPMHEVVVASFDVDRTEVRTKDYVACVKAGACAPPHEDNPFCNTAAGAVAGGRGDHPINCIDAHQAEAYCAFVGKRLPTEREWEYAARGGAEQRRYSWGEEEPSSDRACYAHIGTCPVASFAPGAFGLYDMSGDVWEWTSTYFGPYPGEARTGVHRVYRGGSWSRRFPKWLTTAMRNRYEPGRWSASLGVRCVRTRLPITCPADAEARGQECVRVRGTPRCEPRLAWNGEACTVGGGPTPAPSADPGPAPDAQPITRARTPRYDGDCQAHYPGTPAAYRFSGGTFHARNRPLEAAGCKRRDMGQTWTSACCPG